MANEFKKGQYNISLPNVSANSTLAIEKEQSFGNTVSTYYSIDTTGMRELEIIITPKNINSISFLTDDGTSTNRLSISSVSNTPFINIKFIRSSTTSTTWAYVLYYNRSYSGDDNILSGYFSSAPSSSNPLYPIGFLSNTLMFNTSLSIQCNVDLEKTPGGNIQYSLH